MPKKKKQTNRIQGLFPQPLAAGGVMWHWKPSPRLRRHGFQNRKLGTDYEAAVTAAMARNREVEAWEQGLEKSAPGAARTLPRVLTWDDAVTAYQRHPSFTNLKPSTRRQYKSALNQLHHWALDGRLHLRDIDREMVQDLRNVLVESDRPYRTSALLTVLALFLQWCEDQRYLKANPATRLKIPEPPKRKRRIKIDQLQLIIDSAKAVKGLGHIEPATIAAFFTMQREGDLLKATRFNLVPVKDISPAARRVLAGPDGRVLGLDLTQQKTDTPVVISLPPAVRAMIEHAMAVRATEGIAGGHLLGKAGRTGAIHQKTLQRDWRAVIDHAADAASARQDHELEKILRGLQFRDLRRSGMCWLRDLGIPVPLIAAISGHSIKYTQKILDTYMPADTYAAAEGMAMAVLRQAERDAEDAAMEEQG